MNNGFQLMFKSEKEKEKAKRRWPEVDDGNYRMEKDEQDTKSLTLMNIPMEYPDHFLEQYMMRYVTEPTAEHLTHDGTNLSNGLRLIKYKELRRPIGKMAYVGPDMPAYLVGPVTLPITEMTLFCDRCLQTGHLIFDCPNDVKCRRCRENGHTGSSRGQTTLWTRLLPTTQYKQLWTSS